jgi:hypothetical protein
MPASSVATVQEMRFVAQVNMLAAQAALVARKRRRHQM